MRNAASMAARSRATGDHEVELSKGQLCNRTNAVGRAVALRAEMGQLWKEAEAKMAVEQIKQTMQHQGGVTAQITPEQVIDVLVTTNMGKRLVGQMDTYVRCMGAIAFYHRGIQRLPSAAELIVKESARLRSEAVLVQEAISTPFQSPFQPPF